MRILYVLDVLLAHIPLLQGILFLQHSAHNVLLVPIHQELAFLHQNSAKNAWLVLTHLY
jgi:hypothetical protein